MSRMVASWRGGPGGVFESSDIGCAGGQHGIDRRVARDSLDHFLELEIFQQLAMSSSKERRSVGLIRPTGYST